MIVEGIHLVGSVPLADSETVFRTVAAALGRHLRRLPDGETGARKDWIAWQYPLLAAAPGFEPVPISDRGYLRRQLVHVVGEPRVPPLGYAEAALASFPIFDRLQRAGAIPPGVRFQVSLPTPLAPVTVFVELPDRARVEPLYEARMAGELGRIVDAIPHDRLAIQWDVAVEVGLLEGAWPAHFPDVERGLADRLARLAALVPRDVELGVHLCYGDFGHRHFTIPRDASLLARLARMLPRELAWLHLPVPIEWTERGAYEPLRELPQTDVYLGLVHLADGLEGARRRIALAGEVVPRFGIATECGWGRRPPETIPSLLDLHALLLAAVRTQ